MSNSELKQSFINQISKFRNGCTKNNWDGEGSAALTDSTIDHGLRFIEKLTKYDLLNNLKIRPASNTIIFTWKTDNALVTIEFDDQWDRLLWCIEDKSNNLDYGNAIHLEEVVDKIKQVLKNENS